MPLYEYVHTEPGKPPVVIELLRSVAQADDPVPDPEGRGRVFTRRLSVFAAAGGSHVHTSSCACGKAPGSCGRG
ncbi:MAG: hypothetical protein SFY69_11460 [Planctomycetota bacterium]|nr:hypothetical protein [Planctomycetota bacterium]